MKSELKDISPTRKELHLTIDGAELAGAYSKISQRYARGANVPGFRKGFAPLDVVRVRYKEEIKQEVLQLLLPEKVTEAIREHEIQPLTEPQIHVENSETLKVNGSEPVEVHVHLEVMPEIAVPEYKGMELVRRVKPVEEGDIESLIQNRLGQEAALIPIEDRASEIGDTIIVDLEGKIEGEEQPITAEELELKLGDEAIELSFTENLTGLRPDDEKKFTMTYADDFSSSALAGKTVHYDAKVRSVGKMETPEPSDEWAKSLEEGFDSLDDLRSKLNSDLEVYAGSDADARLRNDAVAKLIEQNKFEVPNVLIENQARNLLNNFANDLQQKGVDLKTVENEIVQMAFQQMRIQAEHDVQGAMLLEKIAEAENIKVTTEEVEEEVNKMASYYGVDVGRIRESLEKQGGTASIENNLRTRRSIETLIEAATITDGEWVDETAGSKDGASNEVTKTKGKAPKKTKGKPAAAKATGDTK